MRINLRQAVCALAEALSLVGIDEHQHGERVACTAVEIARQLGWDERAIGDLFIAGLLHDCGVSSSRVHRALIADMDWEGAILHCVLGEHYLSQFPPTAHLAPMVRHHHTHWEELAGLELDPHTVRAANLLFLADRIDVLRAHQLARGDKPPHELAAAIIAILRDHSPSHFAPELLEAFVQVAKNDAFWYTLAPLELSEYIHTMEREGADELIRFDDIRHLAQIFARIVDAKSDFTFNHSVGVASLARHLAELMAVPSQRIALIEIAALLHDLGKLGVPDEVLEKAGPLTAEEAEVMQRHSYETFRILHHIEGFEEIANWSGNHHETLLGTGYPFHRSDGELSTEARIIAVADIFQALVQDRPYRKGMDARTSFQLLEGMAEEGKIDRELVNLLGNNLDSCWQSANIKGDEWPLRKLN